MPLAGRVTTKHAERPPHYLPARAVSSPASVYAVARVARPHHSAAHSHTCDTYNGHNWHAVRANISSKQPARQMRRPLRVVRVVVGPGVGSGAVTSSGYLRETRVAVSVLVSQVSQSFARFQAGCSGKAVGRGRSGNGLCEAIIMAGARECVRCARSTEQEAELLRAARRLCSCRLRVRVSGLGVCVSRRARAVWVRSGRAVWVRGGAWLCWPPRRRRAWCEPRRRSSR